MTDNMQGEKKLQEETHEPFTYREFEVEYKNGWRASNGNHTIVTSGNKKRVKEMIDLHINER